MLASAAWDADTRADGVGFCAGAIATFALAVFLVLAADALWWHGKGFGGWNAALFRWNADALFVLQISGFAEAANDALESADWAWMGVGAGRGAGRSAGHENLVFLALGHFRRVGEEHVHLGSFALFGTHADAMGITHVSGFAEASNDALFSAGLVGGVGIGAGGWAGGTARVELFVLWAFGNGDFGSHLGSIALFGTHADATRVTHEAGFAEASDHALASAGLVGGVRLGAGGWAGTSAGAEFLIFWALRRSIQSHWDGHGDIVVGLGIAIFTSDAFTLGVFQVSLFTETAADTLEGTNLVWFRVRAVRNAGGSALPIFGIDTALFNRERRDGDS